MRTKHLTSILVGCAVAVVLFAGCHPAGLQDVPVVRSFPPGILAPVQAGGFVGFIDASGAFVIPPSFDDAYPFSEGLALVKKGELWGFIDRTGAIVIPFSIPSDDLATDVGFDEFCGFSSGRFPVGGRYYIDKTGENAFGCSFVWAGPFVDGRAVVTREGVKGVSVIDREGRTISIIEDEEVDFVCNGSLLKVPRSGGQGYIDAEGREIVPCIYGGVTVFSDGLCMALNDEQPAVFFDLTGAQVFQSNGRFEGLFHDGYCETASANLHGLCLYGLMDKRGKLVLDYKWPAAVAYTLGLWGVEEPETENWGYVNLQGAWVIKPQFDSVQPFTEPDKTNVY